MKRMKLVILTAALSLMMSVEALAAGSSSGAIQVAQGAQQATVVKSDGTVSNELVVPVLSGRDQLIDQGDARGVLGLDRKVAVYCMDVSLVLAETGEPVKLNGGITLDFAVPNVTPNTIVKVRHWKDNGSVEDITPSSIGEGRISVTFTSLSPIAIIVDTETDSDPNNDNEESNGSSSSSSTPASSSGTPAATRSGVSPKTAETSMIYGVGGIAVLAVIGLAVCKKKSHS
ncbi:MAG: hypothetical protein HFJ10_07695 [Lachnospiraceae bacterium]|jgi:hypothetical protein|nr:hypothetical protein [Lachnospiraceae bacterium]